METFGSGMYRSVLAFVVFSEVGSQAFVLQYMQHWNGIRDVIL
jgi:hypothetical protein